MFRHMLLKRFMSSGRRVSVISGDGVSRGIIDRILGVFEAASVPLSFDVHRMTGKDVSNPEVMNALVNNIKSNGVALNGSWFTDFASNQRSHNLELRKRLDLWAQVVRLSNYPIYTKRRDLDFTIIRQNTEGEYSQIEHESQPGVVEMFKVITAERSRQIAKFAFDFAKNENRGKVTCVHKANIMKMSDGLFLNECRRISEFYPDITFDSVIIDNCTMQMVRFPAQFDVIVAPNLYGNILINIAAGLVGSSSVLAGANFSDDKKVAVFEAATRSLGDDPSRTAEECKYANPVALLNASIEMLKHLNLNKHAEKIENAIKIVVTTDIARTPDIGGDATTDEFFDAMHKELDTILRDN